MLGGDNTVGDDECCICGAEWNEGQQGWVLCDSHTCENTVCRKCTSKLSLLVSEQFYCPICSGSGESAAATVGGEISTAVAACLQLEKLPLSFSTVQKILTNLQQYPDEQKYRKLRLENKSVKELCDLEPVLNILTSVGFVRTHCARQSKKKKNTDTDLPPTEEVLLLEGPVPTTQVNELLQILNGLSSGDDTNIDSKISSEKDKDTTGEEEDINGTKRKPVDTSEGKEEVGSNKKQKADEE